MRFCFLALLAVLAGAEGFTDIARFGEKTLALLRRFRPFANGTPSHDHLGDIFAALDAAAFRRCFVAWAARLMKTPADLIAIDGKTSRRSGKKGAQEGGARRGAKEAIHMASAFAARWRLALAQTKVNEKSNEIVAIPALLDMLSIEGAVVAIDAMGRQRDIARKVLGKKADHILALKGNQGTLREDVELFAGEQKANGFSDATTSVHDTADGDHGRIETRRAAVIHDVAWLQERHDRPGLKGVGIVESPRQIGGREERETGYYLTASAWRAERLGPRVRDHRAVENGLHWVMDMTFRDDQCRIRTEHAPENLVTVKPMAANLARKARDEIPSGCD
jgi:predicted transposase YbfD/YdcC